MKYFTLITYKNGNVVNMVNFDFFNEIDQTTFEGKEIDKIKLFKLNYTEDGRDLVKEYRINDDILNHEDTKILGYEIVKSQTHSYFFRVKFEMSEEVQKMNELWNKQRYIDLRLKKSRIDESVIDTISGALCN